MHNVATTQCGTVSLRLSRHLIEGDRVAGDAVMHSIECYALYRVPTAQHLVNLMFVVVFRPSLSSGKKNLSVADTCIAIGRRCFRSASHGDLTLSTVTTSTFEPRRFRTFGTNCHQPCVRRRLYYTVLDSARVD